VDSIYTGRDTFLLLKPAIEDQGLEVSFELLEHPYYEGSTRYHSKANKFQISDSIKNAYNVAIKCESAQLILEGR
jgi:hypothetical protein